MTFRERWDAKETKLGKFFKYVLGYCSAIAGIITDIGVNYLPAVSQYVPQEFAHTLIKVGIICYGLGKLTALQKST